MTSSAPAPLASEPSFWMPIVPIGGLRIGPSPLLQWIVVPAAILLLLARTPTLRKLKGD